MAIYSTSKRGLVTVAATTGTLLELVAPAGLRLQIVQWSVSFNGTSATQAPITVQLIRKTVAGTGGTAEAEAAWDEANGVALGAVTSMHTGEGTVGGIMEQIFVHPQSGIVVQYPPDSWPVVALNGIIALRYITPAAVAPEATASLVWNEG